MIMFKTRGGGNSSSLVIAKSVLTQYNPTRLTGTKIWNMKNARYVATPADPSQVPPIKQLAVIGAGQMVRTKKNKKGIRNNMLTHY